MAERSRKASLHAATAALHSKGAAFSSHLHKNKEALLVKSLHYIPLVKRSAALPVKLLANASKDCVPVFKAHLRCLHGGFAALIFLFVMLYYFHNKGV